MMRLSIAQRGKRLIAPLYASDTALFQHCSGGLESVTPEFLKEVVVPLLEIHGVTDIEVPFTK